MALVIKLLVFVALVWGVAAIQKRAYLLQYLYFFRVPIVVGLALALFPIVALSFFAEATKNWFELDFLGLVLVTWLAVLLAWAVMFEIGVLYVTIPKRNELALLRSHHRAKRFQNPMPTPLKRFRLPIFGILAAPLIFACAKHSDLPLGDTLLSIACGLGLAILLWLVSFVRRRHVEKRRARDRVPRANALRNTDEPLPQPPQGGVPSANAGAAGAPTSRGGAALARVGSATRRLLVSDEGMDAIKQGLMEDYDAIFTWGRAVRFVGIVGLLYVAGYFLLKPDHQSDLIDQFPALAYVLILLLLLSFVLTGVTVFFDKFRVPALVALIALPALLASGEHYYELTAHSCDDKFIEAAPMTAASAYGVWSSKHPASSYPTAVVIAASGGGITASRWSAQVLANLQRELGASFSSSIVLVSAVSGGSVGTMYFVDAFTERSPPSPSDLDEIVEAASRTSLGAAAWGLVYPDFLRGLTGISPNVDRAWGQEQRWSQRLRRGATTLRQWREGIGDGWRPITVFNATIKETGEPLAITSVDIPQDGSSTWRSRQFLTLYPGADMRVATAARLSATFPYVTPISRPDLPASCKFPAYHVADGGYYDNYGIVTVGDFLKEVLPYASGRRFLLVQIRASKSDRSNEPAQSANARDVVTGPVETMLSVRTPSQIVRNNRELSQLSRIWSNDKQQLCSVVFELDIPAPLSWHLSRTEKTAISERWHTSENNRESLRVAREFLTFGKCDAAGKGATL